MNQLLKRRILTLLSEDYPVEAFWDAVVAVFSSVYSVKEGQVDESMMVDG